METKREREKRIKKKEKIVKREMNNFQSFGYIRKCILL